MGLILKVLILLISFYLSGCAPLPISNELTLINTPKTQITLKKIPVLTNNELQLLKQNGFGTGLWSYDCRNAHFNSVKYIEDDGHYFGEYLESGKISKSENFYEVKLISPGVLQFKSYLQSKIDSEEYISINKTGYTNGKRILFDQTIMQINGSDLGKEIIKVKDGFEVRIKKDSSFEKIKPSSTIFKCK
jgi:hypothetical protein